MEPLDTDFEYVVREQRQRRSLSRNARYNVLLLLPALGGVWLLYLLGAAVFQWPVSGVVNPVMTIMLLVFLAIVLGLFWASSAKK